MCQLGSCLAWWLAECLPICILANLCPSTQHPLQERVTNTLLEESQMQLAEVFSLVSTSESMDEHGTKFSFLHLELGPVQCHVPKYATTRLTHAPSLSPGVLKSSGCWATTEHCITGISKWRRKTQKMSWRSCGTTDEGRYETLDACGPRLS